MAKFKKKGDGDTPAISTASLPDIVFMLLFFFMVSTVMREVTLVVDLETPSAQQVQKLKRKDLVGYIYVGRPAKDLIQQMGDQHRIQLDDDFAETADIAEFVERVKVRIGDRNQSEVGKMTIAMKIDNETRMKLVGDIKFELRKANALKISYATKVGAGANIE
jgi:biopolymer transport protein ExbD